MGSPEERRRYPRANAPVLYSPAGLRLRHRRRAPRDVSLGGMRVYSDEEVRPGLRLEIELLMPDRTTLRCYGEVVWVDALPAGGPARYDVGIRFSDMAEADIQRLAGVLGR